jgi:energy-converting hydrogenase Eha subunit A
VIAVVGQVFIAITLGTLFAGVFSAALTALVDRIQSIVIFIDQIIYQMLPPPQP